MQPLLLHALQILRNETIVCSWLTFHPALMDIIVEAIAVTLTVDRDVFGRTFSRGLLVQFGCLSGFILI